MEFTKLLGKDVSILITGRYGKKECYSGKVKEATEDFLVIKYYDCTNPTVANPIDEFYVKTSLIESMWVLAK
jgi:hypothetical protein